MQEVDKLNLIINVIPNILEKYMSFTINNKASFIDSFTFLSSSLDSLVKNLSQDDSMYFSQEYHNNVSDLFKQKGFYLYGYMSDFEKFKEKLPNIEKFKRQKIYRRRIWTCAKCLEKLEMKPIKDYHDL